MDEQAAFETRAVLAPRRARLTRLAPLLPVLVLAGIAWAGVSGRPSISTADLPGSSANAAATAATAAPAATVGHSPEPVVVRPDYPAEALGLPVHRLGDVSLALLDRGDVIAIAGWYVPLAITECPRGTPVHGDPSLEIRPGFDPWAYCDRSGVLYASRPSTDASTPRLGPNDRAAGDGPSAVDASLVIGVRLPFELEQVGADPMPIVVLGHFVVRGTSCMLLGACPSELIVDYVAWTALEAG